MKTTGMQNLHLQNQRIQMDNERMRKALREISDWDGTLFEATARIIARAALNSSRDSAE